MTAVATGESVLCGGSLPPDTPLAERIRVTAANGFDGMNLTVREYTTARAGGATDQDIRAMLDDHGVGLADLDGTWDWFADARTLTPAPLDPTTFIGATTDDFFRIADALGARSLNALVITPTDLQRDQLADAYGALCRRAAEHGLLVHLEFVPWGAVPDVETAWAIARDAGEPNGGVALDAWHFYRGDPDLEALRAVPGERITSLQLCDGTFVATTDDPLWEAGHARRCPGDGEFPLTELVDAVVDLDVAAVWGVELYSDEVHQSGADEAARRAATSAYDLMERVGRRQPYRKVAR